MKWQGNGVNVNFLRITLIFTLANNQAQEFWALSIPTPEPHFEPAGMTTPAPLPVHINSKCIIDCTQEIKSNHNASQIVMKNNQLPEFF